MLFQLLLSLGLIFTPILLLVAVCKSASELAPESSSEASDAKIKDDLESALAPLSGEAASSASEGRKSAETLPDSKSLEPAGKTSTTITSKVGQFIGGLAEGVTSTVSSVASSVGDVILGGPEKTAQLQAQSSELNFLQLGVGGYRGKTKSDSAAIVMADLESVMGFLKDAEFTHSQPVFGDWLEFDFSKFQVVAIVHRNKKRGFFLKIDRLLYNGSLVASGELYEEDPSCSLNEWISSEVSFSLLKVPKSAKLAKLASGESSLALSAPERKACHGMLGSFIKSAQADAIPFEKEWHGKVANPGQRLRIYRRTWGEWDQFIEAYCPSCRMLETRYGFPTQKLAIQVTEPGQGNIHVKKIFKAAGMYFI